MHNALIFVALRLVMNLESILILFGNSYVTVRHCHRYRLDEMIDYTVYVAMPYSDHCDRFFDCFVESSVFPLSNQLHVHEFVHLRKSNTTTVQRSVLNSLLSSKICMYKGDLDSWNWSMFTSTCCNSNVIQLVKCLKLIQALICWLWKGLKCFLWNPSVLIASDHVSNSNIAIFRCQFNNGTAIVQWWIYNTGNNDQKLLCWC